MQTPTIGRVVHYTLTNDDAVRQINRRRNHARAYIAEHREHADGSQVHVGNDVQAGDVYPLVITRVWSDQMVNGQVLLDGNDTLWVTSRHEGDAEGQWRWPERTDQ